MLKSIVCILLLGVCLVSANKHCTYPRSAFSAISGGLFEKYFKQNTLIVGAAQLWQHDENSSVIIRLNVTFFATSNTTLNESKHGIHIHEFGISDTSADPTVACESCGPHWNPMKKLHGDLNSTISHMGDLGNVVLQPVEGRIETTIVSDKLKLCGRESIIGRSIVLHEKPDDLGLGRTKLSTMNGASGRKIACGNIVYARPQQ